MTKIFINHATKDKKIAGKLKEVLQTEFDLKRENFFLTSDYEFSGGDKWIEEIQVAMQESTAVLSLVTPNYLNSQFCLCELGAAWMNHKTIIPVVIPPLDKDAFMGTPYQTNLQAIILSNLDDVINLGEAVTNKCGLPRPNPVRFKTKAQEFCEDTLFPCINELKAIKSLTEADFKKLEEELSDYKVAYEEVVKESAKYKKENEVLRKMKDAEEIKEMDYAQLDEWETFEEAVHEAQNALRPLSTLTTSVLFHSYSSQANYGGYIGAQEDNQALNTSESEGLVYFQDEKGWLPDEDHILIRNAQSALKSLDNVIDNLKEEIIDKFEKVYGPIRLELRFKPFWEKVLLKKIFISNQ